MNANWRLYVWDANTTHANQTAVNARATYSKASPGGLLDGFDWSMAPSGDCKAITFWGAPTDHRGNLRLDVKARDIIRLEVDDDNDGVFDQAFTGVVTENPSARQTIKSEFTAKGSWLLIKQRSVDTREITTRQDVSEYVDDLSDLMPTQVGYAKPPATGFELSEFRAPGIRLSEAFELLRDSLQTYDTGVDGAGDFIFEEPSGSTSIAYASAGLRRLPITSEQIATKINLILLSDQFGGVIMHSYEDPLHSTYGAERTYILPQAQTYQEELTPTDYEIDGTAQQRSTQGGWEAWNGSTGALSDDSSTTTLRAFAAENTDPSVFCQLSIRQRGLMVAFDAPTYVAWAYVEFSSGDDRELILGYDKSSTLGNGIRWVGNRFSGYLAVDQEVSNVGLMAVLNSSCSGYDVRVTEFIPYTYDTDALDRIAKTLIRLPAQEPMELDVPGYVAPVPSVTVTGAPGGDVTGDAAEFRYTLTLEGGLRTVIDLEERSEPDAARRIRFNAEQVTQVSQDTLRVHLTR